MAKVDHSFPSPAELPIRSARHHNQMPEEQMPTVSRSRGATTLNSALPWAILLALSFLLNACSLLPSPAPDAQPPSPRATGAAAARPATSAATARPNATSPAPTQPPATGAPQPTKPQRSTAAPQPTAQPARPIKGFDSATADELPEQARQTLARIARGGPFPHRQDGAVFQNRERLLPRQPSGYYHEYTVETPGSDDRGARRIITGAAGEIFYTEDHYASFIQVLPT